MSANPEPTPLPRGTFSPPGPTDIRGPCPMLNSLANHGYIPRHGRNVCAADVTAALHDTIGVSTTVSSLFTYPIFLEHKDPVPSPSGPASFRHTSWHYLHYLHHPSTIFSRWGMRRPNQRDPATGRRCLDLDQLATPGVIEHDISLTRRDRAQGDCITPQPDLVEALLDCSSDGGETIAARDLAGFRELRIATQKEQNPDALYGRLQHSFACMEIALLLGTFGDGEQVSVDFSRAFFREERLPLREGWDWKERKGWSRRLGLWRLVRTSWRVRRMVKAPS
ncbi:Chloroperoxidase [Lasiosphaeris hirsuta]|uniref:Chloroperoxidase n=1 Tax=Lasiosphaeris hirsuta TaxID=260670 RepID=A0AA40DSP1_9PEZI|nr:Chloroperoxidase [Lasiosphaeris hirsuta]